MSYFACISIDKKVKKLIITLINSDANNSYIGKLTNGSKKKYSAYFLNIFFHDAKLIIDNKEKENFLSTLELLRNNTFSFYIIIHWFHGNIDDEKFELTRDEKISFNDFKNKFPNLDCDVKYRIVFNN